MELILVVVVVVFAIYLQKKITEATECERLIPWD